MTQELFAAAVIVFALAVVVGPLVLEAYHRAERRWRQKNGLDD